MAGEPSGTLIRYRALTFDLSRMFSPDLLTRVRAALLIGLESAPKGPNLQRLLETLTALSLKEPVRFFTNPQKWRPGASRPSYPAVCNWTSTKQASAEMSLEQIRSTRSAVRIFMQDLGDTFAGTLETTWHELLHPTVPLTHPQEGLPPDVYVDYPKWIGEIYGLKRELPASVVDPVTGQRQSTDHTWSMNKPYCIECSRQG